MHELALADAVITAALRVADANGMSRVHAIDVRVGELQSIRVELMDTLLRDVLPPDEPRLTDVSLRLAIDPARFRCRPCAREFGLEDVGGHGDDTAREAIHFVPELCHSFLGCPDCGSADFDVTAGRGVSIDSIEGE